MTAKVISGEVLGVKGPIEAKVPTYFIDFYLNKDKQYDHPIPKGWNSMIILHKGKLEVFGSGGSKTISGGDCVAFEIS